MRPFAAVKRFFERLFERPTARLFGARLQPVQIERRLERAMENERLTTGGRTLVPNRYAVRLNPDDLAAFAELAEPLAVELADACLTYARRHGYKLTDRPEVVLMPDEHVESGDAQVDARFGHGGEDGRPRAAADVGQPREGSEGERRSEESFVTPDGQGPFHREPANVADHTMVFEIPQVHAPRALLRLVLSDGTSRDVPVSGRPLSIGRATDNDLVVRDGRVSRHHARLQGRNGALVLTDLGSTNGTRVNGMIVNEIALGEGDRVEIGDSLLLVESASGH